MPSKTLSTLTPTGSSTETLLLLALLTLYLEMQLLFSKSATWWPESPWINRTTWSLPKDEKIQTRTQELQFNNVT